MNREPDSITKTSALEQHAQTIMTAVLTAGIVTAVGFAWRSNESMTRVVTLQESQVNSLKELTDDVRSIRDRSVTYEVRLARIETLIDTPAREQRQAEMRPATRAENQERQQ